VFPYDPELLAAVRSAPQTVADVIRMLDEIQSLCIDGDGLKWFNGLYLQVTQAVQARAALRAGAPDAFVDASWIAALDATFAGFYFAALKASLSGAETPGCWQAVFGVRNQPAIARIQFAMAGMNAHINHDLPQAVVATCKATGIRPEHGSPQYSDFTAINATLDGLIAAARNELHVRLLGDALPPVSRLEDTLAAWSVSAARESAWNNAELLWNLGDVPPLSATFLDTLDGFTSLAGKALLVPVP
jgi:hypothetical protein